MPSATAMACILLSTIAIAPAFRVRPKKAAEKARNATKPKWITIGDSYISGAGIHTAHRDYEGGNGGCYRDWDTVPGAKYARQHNMVFDNKACAGNEIHNIYSYLDILSVEYPEDTAKQWEGSIIHLSVGGNTLRTNRGEGWEGLLLRCVLTLDACSKYINNQVGNWNETEAELTALYTRLVQFAGKARIRVQGYPRLMRFNGWCWAVPGMTGTEARWMDTMVDDLNVVINRAISAAKLTNPDADIRYAGVGNYVTLAACSFSNRQISGIVLSHTEGGIPSPATIHPQQRGYDKMLEAVEATL